MKQSNKEVVLIRQRLNESLPKKVIKEIKMLANNKTNLILTKNLEDQNQIKNINIIYYHIYELIEYEKLEIK